MLGRECNCSRITTGSVVITLVTLETCIRELLGSNVSQVIRFPDCPASPNSAVVPRLDYNNIVPHSSQLIVHPVFCHSTFEGLRYRQHRQKVTDRLLVVLQLSVLPTRSRVMLKCCQRGASSGSGTQQGAPDRRSCSLGSSCLPHLQ
jgi:hypothetical protein